MHGSDPVVVTVSQLRQRIFEAVGHTTPAHGSQAGTLFHKAAAAVLDPHHPAHWEQIVTNDSDSAWRLAATVYDTVLSPELARCRAALTGEQVLAVWNGVQAFARWFANLIEKAQRRGALHYDPILETWTGAEDLFRAELPVSRTFHEPGWRAPVVVTGIADEVIRIDRTRLCVVELKLGAGHAEADALQACLYHEILAPAGTAAALVRFDNGDAHELVLSSDLIRDARPALMNLIASIAGVIGQPKPVPPPPACTDWPKPPGEDELELGRRLVKALAEFRTDARLAGSPIVGPAFVRFFVETQRGVAPRKLLTQGVNLQTRLGVNREPVIHIDQGRVAIDIARPARESVLFSQLRARLPHDAPGSKAVIGIDLNNNLHFLDFAAPEHAHALVCGVAGSGKSEWLRTALASLMLANTPATLRLVLVDPKRNAFPDLAGSPYLLHADALLYPPQDDIMPVLEQLIDEMEHRSHLFGDAKANDLAGYCRKTGAPLARILLVCDEFADLVMASKQQRAAIELAINRLGQKARAAGIHLVIATQTPRKEVVSGILRANTPARVALRVTTAIESRLILDRNGAEKLLGRGDLLFASNHEPIRLQAPYLPEAERVQIFRAVLEGAARSG